MQRDCLPGDILYLSYLIYFIVSSQPLNAPCQLYAFTVFVYIYQLNKYNAYNALYYDFDDI